MDWLNTNLLFFNDLPIKLFNEINCSILSEKLGFFNGSISSSPWLGALLSHLLKDFKGFFKGNDVLWRAKFNVSISTSLGISSYVYASKPFKSFIEDLCNLKKDKNVVISFKTLALIWLITKAFLNPEIKAKA